MSAVLVLGRIAHEQTQRVEDFEDWLARWVAHVSDRGEYLKQVGAERMQSLGVKEHAYTAPADFGY